MKAGFACMDITPPPGQELSGYGYFLHRRAAGTLDPLYARALALADEQSQCVIVQLDLIGLDDDFVSDVRRSAEETLQLPHGNLMLHCTHTHTGPATAHLEGCGEVSDFMMRMLHANILCVVREALRSLRPVTGAKWFDKPFNGFAHNRVGGVEIDRNLRGLWIDLEGAQPILVLSYACHPVTLGKLDKYSADYPGAIAREFAAYGIRFLYMNGCCGDINPLQNAFAWGSGTAETLAIYGRDAACAAKEALLAAEDVTLGPIGAESEHVPVPHRVPSVDELQAKVQQAQAALQKDPLDGKSLVVRKWAREMLYRYADGTIDEPMTAEVQAIVVGDVIFVGLGGEVFTEIGRKIREAFPNRKVLVAGTTNGLLSYIPDRRDVEKGGYASTDAAVLYGARLPAPNAGEAFAEGAIRVVRSVIHA